MFTQMFGGGQETVEKPDKVNPEGTVSFEDLKHKDTVKMESTSTFHYNEETAIIYMLKILSDNKSTRYCIPYSHQILPPLIFAQGEY